MREISRDPGTVSVLIAFFAILSWSCMASSGAWSEQNARQSALQNQSREEWLSQETDSPHQATHHGTTVYKLPTPLTSFDPGVAPELGTAVKLEAHQRHDAVGVAKADEISLLELNLTTPALLMQAVLPVVVILLSHAMVSRERELGTWGLLTSLGVSHRGFILGKFTALFMLMVMLSAPALMSLLWNAVRSPVELETSTREILARSVTLYAVNVLYLAGWCAAGTALSARYSSGTTLIVLLSCWAAWTLIIPRLAADLAYSRFPLPSEQSLQELRETLIRQGSDGRTSLEELNAALEARLLSDYDVTELDQLPINLDAARLLAMEEFTDAIDDNTQRQLEEIYQQQNRFLDRFECVSPYLAMRSLSSSLAATDRHHHIAFVDSTEKYRRLLVEIMNRAEMTGERPGSTPASARVFWGKVPEFRQSDPSITRVLYAMRWPIGVLAAWLVLTMTWSLVPARGTLA